MPLNSQLLKFSGPTPYALDNLENGRIFCRHFNDYNDPFEFWTRISAGIPDPDREPERFLAAVRAWGFDSSTVAEAMRDPVIVDHAIDYFDECQHYAPQFEVMRQGMRIACFGSERDNLLMWSHYADGLRGFCIVFDEDLLMKAGTNDYVLDVAYMDTPPKVDSFIYGVAWDQDWYSRTAIEETNVMIKHQGKTERQADIPMYEEAGAEALRTMREIWQHVFATKPAEWRYERERRLLVQTAKTDTAPVFRNYDRESIKEVILGERMPEDFRARVLAVLQQRYPGTPVTTAHRAQGAYTLVID